MDRETSQWTIPPRSGTITALAWSADGTHLAIVTSRGWLIIWSLAAPARARWRQRLGPTRLLTVAWARQGHSLAVGGANGALYRIHLTGAPGSHLLVTRHLCAGAITQLAWSSSPLDRCLVVVGSRRVTILDVRGCQMILQYHAPILDAAWSIDGRTFALVCQGGLLEIWDAEQQRLCFSSAVAVESQCLSWSRDGQRLALGTRQGLLHLCHPRTGTIDQARALARFPIHLLAWGARYLIAVSEQDVTLWNETSLPTILRAATPVQALAIDPPGALLATAQSDIVSLTVLGKGEGRR